jgi:hypothetical protein
MAHHPDLRQAQRGNGDELAGDGSRPPKDASPFLVALSDSDSPRLAGSRKGRCPSACMTSMPTDADKCTEIRAVQQNPSLGSRSYGIRGNRTRSILISHELGHGAGLCIWVRHILPRRPLIILSLPRPRRDRCQRHISRDLATGAHWLCVCDNCDILDLVHTPLVCSRPGIRQGPAGTGGSDRVSLLPAGEPRELGKGPDECISTRPYSGAGSTRESWRGFAAWLAFDSTCRILISKRGLLPVVATGVRNGRADGESLASARLLFPIASPTRCNHAALLSWIPSLGGVATGNGQTGDR